MTLSNPSFEVFNSLEAFFWFIVGVFVLFVFKKMNLNRVYILIALLFFCFGLSDIMEVIFGSFFEPRMKWLLIWKIINLVGIVSLPLFLSIKSFVNKKI